MLTKMRLKNYPKELLGRDRTIRFKYRLKSRRKNIRERNFFLDRVRVIAKNICSREVLLRSKEIG